MYLVDMKLDLSNLKALILKYGSNIKVYHIVFWLGFYALLVFTDNKNTSLHLTCFKEGINVLFYALVVYVNILFIIPVFLKKKRYFEYASILITFLLIITPIKASIFFYIFNKQTLNTLSFSHYQLFILTSNVFFIIMSTIFHIIVDWQRTQQNMNILALKTTQSELNFLKTQINPHFLFNTLNNLYAQTLTKSDNAPETVLKLSEIMRYMLYDCNEAKVDLQKEVNYIYNYIALEKLRLSNQYLVNFNIQGDPSNYTISPLLFTPFIENAFKHGITKSIESGFIDINLLIESDYMTFTIKNSIGQLSQPTSIRKERSGGIGLENVKRRLAILYPKQHELDVKQTDNNYQVILKLKLNYK